MMPTPVRLSHDLVGCWRDYDELGLPRRTRVLFCLLRVGQRLSYWIGWVAGSRPLRRWSP